VSTVLTLPSLQMIPVDTSAEWPKIQIWGFDKVFLCCSFIFTYLNHINNQNNIVSNWRAFFQLFS